MADKQMQQWLLDDFRINVHEPLEVRWWCKELHATPEQLKEAVDQVGTGARKVRERLTRVASKSRPRC